MKLILEIVILYLISDIECFNRSEKQPNFQYEVMHRYGAGKRIIPDFHSLAQMYMEHPQPLAITTTLDPKALIHRPYHSLYQGRRTRQDMKVYKKSFRYPTTPTGHRVLCDHILNCTITFIAVETKTSIPIMLRGGAGYQHFTVVVKAKPYQPLDGTVRAYCRKVIEDTW